MIWLDLNLRRSFAWVFQSSPESHVRLKDSQLIALINTTYRFLNAGTTARRTPRFSALEIELIEEDIINQVIQMKKRLNLLQV
jgi:hypothetical protein